MRRKIKIKVMLALLACSVALTCGTKSASAAKKLKVTFSSTQVTVGTRLSAKSKVKDITYTSSNSNVASVSKDGIITGKREGKVQIKAKRSGYQTAVYQITVKAAAGKPTLPVALDEVMLQNAKMQKDGKGNQRYSAVVKNTAKKGTVRKIQYYYEIQVPVQKASVPTPVPATTSEPGNTEVPADASTVTVKTSSGTQGSTGVTKKKMVILTAKSIKAGKKSARVHCEGDVSGSLSKMKLIKIKLYTGDALYTYTVPSGRATLKWGTKDTKAPVFSGWVGKKSAYAGEPIRVCYSDRKKTYQFKEHVTAVDDRDGKVKITVDTSGINWKKDGVYKVKYQAKDKAGNIGKAWAKVQVFVSGTPEAIADEVLGSITKKSWSAERKLRAIYRYAHGHCSYVDNGTHKNWRNTAVRGIRYQSGDCFTFYAISKLLITRAGIPNLTVTRYPVVTGSHHWWNLVYVRGGWYHFDTTPRQRRGNFCLVTDAQLRTYSTGSTFRYQTEKYPVRAKKKISPNP